MALNQQKVQDLISLVKIKFPEWDGFDHEEFKKEEIYYKKDTINKAAELINKKELSALIQIKEYDEFIARVEKIGKDNNLLWYSVPREGDLKIFHQKEVDKALFCQSFFDLLYGFDDVSKRLARYLDYIKSNNLPNNWTFPTYFLFITNPKKEYFVKPRTAKWFLDFIGKVQAWNKIPSPETYDAIKKCIYDLKNALQKYNPQDLVDIQSFIWIAHQASYHSSRKKNKIMEEPVDSYNSSSNFFAAKIFELLKELHQNPTQKFYSSKREEFKQYLEQPMKNLLQNVAENLPDMISETMETKRKLFSRIVKNDYGRGGAWDYYWGAFYPKGGKRTEDAQLYISINKDRLEYGFYIGDYGGNQKKKFVKNCSENAKYIIKFLENYLDKNFTYGFHEVSSKLRFVEWINNISTEEIVVSLILTNKEILKLSDKELIESITNGFIQLFPFVILSISDNPIAEIDDYLGHIEGTEDEIDIQPPYSLSEMSKDTGIEEEKLKSWKNAINRKGQAIFYGPPGTGKTFIAQKLAKHLVENKDGFIELVQFHPAYSYEDFIQGIRPQTRLDGTL